MGVNTIFEPAAVSIREEDMSVVKAALDALEQLVTNRFDEDE